MPRLVPQLAKLTRPKLYNVLARSRLFARIDAGRERPVTWVVGPPGSGKTALVASYLDLTKAHSVWIHLDGGDHDLATFFHYLSRSANLTTRHEALPVITPEHFADLPAFTRYYFREFYARLKHPAIVVLDNYQEIPPGSSLHGVLSQAALESPESVSLIIISREDPPPEFARLDASDRLARIEWKDLRLTFPEAAAISKLRFDLDGATLQELYEASDGWAAGLTLALERMKRADGGGHGLRGDALESVFNYFAGQVFNSTDAQTQEFLMRTALLPRTTVDMAQALTGNALSGRLLDSFYRRRLFTDRRGGYPYSYQYHDLFRAFLLDKLAGTRTRGEVDDLRRHAGSLLEGVQRYDEAVLLYQSAGDWLSVSNLAVSQAQALIGQGRAETLRQWITSLPEAVVTSNPWLDYWHGIALLASAPDKAIKLLARAYQCLQVEGDRSAQAECCSAIVTAHMSDLTDFRPLAEWIEKLLALLRDPTTVRSPLTELRSSAAIVYFCHERREHLEHFEPAVRSALDLLARDSIAVNDKIVPSCLLLHSLREAARFAECDAIIACVQPYLASASVSPGDRAYWYQVLAWAETSRGNLAAATAACSESVSICAAHAISSPARNVFTELLLAAIAFQAGELALAEAHLARMEQFMSPQRTLSHAWASWIRSVMAAMRDDFDSAVTFAERELEILSSSGAFFHLYFAHLHHAAGLIGQQRFQPAHEAIERARRNLTGSPEFAKLADVDMMGAWLALARGDQSEFERSARSGLAALRRSEAHACLWYVDRRILPAVLDRALTLGIEPGQVREIIRAFGIKAPPKAGADWPWPLRMRVLGGFELLINDAPLATTRKPPRKLLALLKALACAGPAGATEAELHDWLWPDSEADSARKALDVSLHRLRSLLGEQEAVGTGKGRVFLNRSRVRVDAWAFEALAHGAPESTLSIEEISALYPGNVLPEDVDAVWSVSCRERLRETFNRLILAHAARLETAVQFAQALRWYQCGMETDDLVEAMYQGVMRCQIRLDLATEALGTFERLRRTFALKLRALPSAVSVELAESLRTSRRARAAGAAEDRPSSAS